MSEGGAVGFSSQWNPRRSRGASRRRVQTLTMSIRLSGTPAEAGVRGRRALNVARFASVSVEPPPKQGCERTEEDGAPPVTLSQWNPRRSRGAR